MKITTPFANKDIEKLKIGDKVFLNGVLYTARDAAHKRLIELIEKGKELPFDIKGQIIYYAGPAPARPGKVIGPVGPTTSYRMDPYTPKLIEKGLRGMIGKGSRGPQVVEALKKYRAIYFTAVGGTAALISQCIKKVDIVAYPDLGPEAIRRLEVEEFPVIVANDCYGGDLFKEGVKKYKVT